MHAVFSDPGGRVTPGPALVGALVLPSAIVMASAPTVDFSGLNHTAYTFAVYASRPGLPQGSRKTRFRLGASLRRAGFSPAWVSFQGFSSVILYIASSLARLSWRTTTSFSAGR
jgi:hypothetical protein